MNIKNNFLLFVGIASLCINATRAQEVFPKSEIIDRVPQPIFEKDPELVDLYYKTWEIAHSKIKHQQGIPSSPYMDEGLWDDTIWIWDTEFMVMFCKYAPESYPGIESMQNFYKTILEKESTSLRIQHPDNPPFMSWIEFEYFKFTNDTAHVKELINENRYLQRHWEWFHDLKQGHKMHFDHAWMTAQWEEVGYRWGGIQSGMDNTPRGDDKGWEILWVDAIAQQALSALYIAKLCEVADNKADEKLFMERYRMMSELINEYYWDEEDGFYYDINIKDHTFSKCVTPASYWVLLAETADKSQAYQMMLKTQDENKLGGIVPWPTVARDDEDFDGKDGMYWRGSMWLPTAYTGIKSLEKYGYFQQANQQSLTIVNHMKETYKRYSPHTIWECYNPTRFEPALHAKDKRVREDFCGWSALGPISLFIENVLGFYDVNAAERSVKWNLYNSERHGIKKLKFGDIKTDIIYQEGFVSVESNANYDLVINGKRFKVKPGANNFKVTLSK